MKNRRVLWGSAILSATMVLGSAGTAMAGVLHEASGNTPAFPNLYVIGWTLVDFLILLAVMYKFAFNPVKNMLAQRSAAIQKDITTAEEMKKEMEELKADAEAVLVEAKKESQAIIVQAQQNAESLKSSMIAETEQEIAALKAKAEKDIADATEAARQQLREDAANLAVLAAEKLLERSITEEDNIKFVKQFVNEAGDLVC